MLSRAGLTVCSLFSLVLYTVGIDPSQIQVYPENGGISGVFLVMLKSKIYSFNVTTAREVCESLGVHIATRAEVQQANSKGLQTCRFGWVKEQMAVIPRTEGNHKCGQNKVGLISWAATPSTSFDVFCFNSTVTVIIPKTTNPMGKRPGDKTTSPSLILSTLHNKHVLLTSPAALTVSSGFSTSSASTFLLSSLSSLPTRSPSSLPHTSHHYQLTTSSSSSVTFPSPHLSSHPFTRTSPLPSPSKQAEVATQLPPLPSPSNQSDVPTQLPPLPSPSNQSDVPTQLPPLPSPSNQSDVSTQLPPLPLASNQSDVPTQLPPLPSPSNQSDVPTQLPPLPSPSNQSEVPTQLPSQARTPFGEVPIACVTIAVILLMATAGGICYFKIKRSQRLPPWVRMHHKDMTETEMWKTDSDLQCSNKEQNSYCDEILLQAEEDSESY